MHLQSTMTVATVLLLAGCYDARSIRTHDDASRPGAGVDSGAAAVDSGPPPPPTGKLDLLFMVDNSNSMIVEQVSLADELPALMTALATGDHDGDGARDARPFESIQVGVITPDLGSGGSAVPTCERPDFGDDGILRTQGRVDVAGCSAAYPSILAYDATSGIDAVDFASDVACVAYIGTGGCGFEQQLESVLKAITPSRAQTWTASTFVPIGTPGAGSGLSRPFFRTSSPHGDGANLGFVRDDSMLAVVMLTDEDDCSAHDAELYDVASGTYAGDLNLRCFTFDEIALHPIDRYVEGLLQLRRHPSRLAFFPIAGMPVDLEPAAGEAIDWDRLVGPSGVRDPRMEWRVDPDMPNRLLPSCNTPLGIAFPPERIFRVARELEERGARIAVGSVCQDAYAFGSFLTALSR